MSFKERGVWTERLRQLNEADITCQWNGQPIGFRAYIENQAGEEIAQDHRENSVRYECEGTHWRERAVEIRYEPGEFILNNIDLESMTIFFRFIVTVRRQRLRSKFELEGQGRMFSFELIDNVISGKPLEVVLVQRF